MEVRLFINIYFIGFYFPIKFSSDRATGASTVCIAERVFILITIVSIFGNVIVYCSVPIRRYTRRVDKIERYCIIVVVVASFDYYKIIFYSHSCRIYLQIFHT